MADTAMPIRQQNARLLGERSEVGTLFLYPDKMAYVPSQVLRWASGIGFLLVAVPSFALPPHIGPGALGGAIGAGGGGLIGGAIAKSRAARRVAAAADDVTVIPLDSIAAFEARKSGRALTRHSLVVTTTGGVTYGFALKPAEWSAALASALTARGCGVTNTLQGTLVTPASGTD
jgi:hypothetical protein